jgi:hypothetical protein
MTGLGACGDEGGIETLLEKWRTHKAMMGKEL